jgi:hypothetical protein
MPAPPAPPEAFEGLDLGRFASRLLRVCLVGVGVLAVLDVLIAWQLEGVHETVRALFNTAKEKSLGTWFSATLWFLAGAFAGLAWWAGRRAGLGRSVRAGLLLGAGFFTFLAVDDTLALHEGLGTMLADQHGGEAAQVSYGWHTFILPVYALVALLVLVLVGPELRRRRLLAWFLAGGGLMAFAQGLDWLEGRAGFRAWLTEQAAALGVDRYDLSHPPRLLEETCEMVALLLIGQAFLRLAAALLDGRRLVLRGGQRTPA